MLRRTYENGWVQLDTSCYLIGAYWLDPFPVATDEEIREGHGRGPDKRISPIYDYDDGGIGRRQWLNATHDAAAVLCQDGGWKNGGEFHLWVSPGVGRRPYEVPIQWPIRIKAGDPSGWEEMQNQAVTFTEQVLGLVPARLT